MKCGCGKNASISIKRGNVTLYSCSKCYEKAVDKAMMENPFVILAALIYVGLSWIKNKITGKKYVRHRKKKK